MNRIWKCITCRRTFDLAIIAPQHASLSDEELDSGAWHNCPGGPVNLFEEDRPKVAKTEYDWRTGKAK